MTAMKEFEEHEYDDHLRDVPHIGATTHGSETMNRQFEISLIHG